MRLCVGIPTLPSHLGSSYGRGALLARAHKRAPPPPRTCRMICLLSVHDKNAQPHKGAAAVADQCLCIVCVSMCVPLRRSMPAGCVVRPCVSMCARSTLKPCAKDPKKVQLRNQQCRFPFITELKSPEISYTSTPSLLPTHDFPAVSIPIHYSFVTLHYSLVTRNRGGLSAHSIS